MFIPRLFCNVLLKNKFQSIRFYGKHKNPFYKTLDIMSRGILNKENSYYPEHVDVVVIGGGFIGSSVAYSLKSRTGEGLSVIVLEKDLTYSGAKNNISLGTLTQHFSLPENIYLSQYCTEFLRNAKEHLGRHVDIKYQPFNHLVLACEKYAEKLEENVKLQSEYGVRSEILLSNDISNRYPWLKIDDIKLGCLGIEAEGVFSSWELLKGIVDKSQELGATYINAEVIGFELEKQRDVLMEGIAPGTFQRINKVVYKTPDNEEHTLKFAACILAAGDKSSEIARMAKIGMEGGLLAAPLPIEERKFNVYSIESKDRETGLNTPLISDTSGLCLRRNGLESNLLCSHIPLLTEETKSFTENEYYYNVVAPSLNNRINVCAKTEITKLNAEKQDCNTFDHTGILGPHPYHNNLYIAAGFGKYGCIHAPGLGRAIAELIIDSQFTTIDLSRFGYDRLLTNEPLVELNIY